MQTERRHSKREILGQLRVEYLFAADELQGVSSSSTRWEVLAAFLEAGDGCAERLIETEGGLIFLQSVPGRPNTGAVYVYNEAHRVFFWMRFDRDDDLNGRDFDQAVGAYRLLQFTRVVGDRPSDSGRSHQPITTEWMISTRQRSSSELVH